MKNTQECYTFLALGQEGTNALLLSPKKFQEYKYKEEQRIVASTGIYTSFSRLKQPQRAVIIKKQQKYKYEEKECAVVFPAAAFDI
jgi:hypothetical protein